MYTLLWSGGAWNHESHRVQAILVFATERSQVTGTPNSDSPFKPLGKLLFLVYLA